MLGLWRPQLRLAGLNQPVPAPVSDLQTDMQRETCITGAHRRTQTRYKGTESMQ